jgi:hypothetical protein
MSLWDARGERLTTGTPEHPSSNPELLTSRGVFGMQTVLFHVAYGTRPWLISVVSLAVRYATTNSKVLSAEVVYCVVESATTNGEVKANGLAAFELGGESGHTVTVGICGMSASLQAELEMVFEIRATVTRTQDEQPENLLHPSDFCCWDWVSESCRADVFLTVDEIDTVRTL